MTNHIPINELRGNKLKAAVAEEVMGWVRVNYEEATNSLWGCPPAAMDLNARAELPDFLSWEGIGQVIDVLATQGYRYGLRGVGDGASPAQAYFACPDQVLAGSVFDLDPKVALACAAVKAVRMAAGRKAVAE